MSFAARGARFRDGLVDRAFDLGRIDRRRQVAFEHGDLGGFRAASSCRPPFVNCSTESRRCLMSDAITCCASPSSSARPFSTSRFISAALAMRSGMSRAWSLLRIAAVMSALIFLSESWVKTIS